MKSVFIVLPSMLMLAGCSTQPDAPMPRKWVWRIRHPSIASKKEVR